MELITVVAIHFLNAMFCFSKFNVNISNICGGVVNVRRVVDQYAERKVEEHLMQAADFIRELLNVGYATIIWFFRIMLILIAKNFMHKLDSLQFARTCNPA